jgi:hypothetical protein
MRTKAFAALLALLVAAVSASAQSTKADTAVVTELKAFYEAYGEDLIQKRTESIANRYDPRGTYFLGNGSKAFATFEQTKRSYMTRWTGPKSFAWKDLEYEVITPTAANVVGRFEWARENEPQPKLCSYSALLLKNSGQWRIRIEDESCPTK